MVRAVLLGRVSRGERQQDPENQLGALRSTAGRLGWHVAKELSFKLSAWDDEQAADVWRQTLAAITEAQADTLMVWASDRAFREGVRVTLNRLWDLEKHYGVQFYSLQEPFLSTATADPHMREMMVSLFAWVANQESVRKSERLKAKAETKRNRAEALGQRADWGRGKMATEADKARVRDLAAAGRTQRQIVAETGLSKGTVARILVAPPQAEGQKPSSLEKRSP